MKRILTTAIKREEAEGVEVEEGEGVEVEEGGEEDMVNIVVYHGCFLHFIFESIF